MPNFDIDYFKRTVALQADGNDIVHVEDCDDFLQITVFDSTDPDAKIAWQGFIKNADYVSDEPCPACGAAAGEPCDPTALEDFDEED